jgi:proteasome lid subunit RPN8/RPN11
LFSFSPAALQSMRIHAERVYPMECCGALLSDGARLIVASRELPNQARMKAKFDVDIVALDALYDEAAQQSLSVVGIYHSHTEVGAYFSESDRLQAGDDPMYPLYVVLGVRRGACDEIKAFTWSGAQFIEESLL